MAKTIPDSKKISNKASFRDLAASIAPYELQLIDIVEEKIDRRILLGAFIVSYLTQFE